VDIAGLLSKAGILSGKQTNENQLKFGKPTVSQLPLKLVELPRPFCSLL
jgi:hypothetical protein